MPSYYYWYLGSSTIFHDTKNRTKIIIFGWIWDVFHFLFIFLQEEQEKKTKNRKDAQAIAAFNLSVAEGLKAKKDVRDATFERSYVFRNRCVTPPHYVKQEDYAQDLHQQVCDFRWNFQRKLF